MRKNRDHFVTSDSCDYDNNSNDDAGDVCKTLSSATSDNCVVGHQVAQQQCIMIAMMMMMMVNKAVIITWKMMIRNPKTCQVFGDGVNLF